MTTVVVLDTDWGWVSSWLLMVPVAFSTKGGDP